MPTIGGGDDLAIGRRWRSREEVTIMVTISGGGDDLAIGRRTVAAEGRVPPAQ